MAKENNNLSITKYAFGNKLLIYGTLYKNGGGVVFWKKLGHFGQFFGFTHSTSLYIFIAGSLGKSNGLLYLLCKGSKWVRVIVCFAKNAVNINGSMANVSTLENICNI